MLKLMACVLTKTYLKAESCVCACVYLLQGAERWVAATKIKSAVSCTESRQVPQSQILRQQQALDQTGLLTLI